MAVARITLKSQLSWIYCDFLDIGMSLNQIYKLILTRRSLFDGRLIIAAVWINLANGTAKDVIGLGFHAVNLHRN